MREKTNTVPLSARDMNPATAPVHGTNETKVPDSASRPSMSSARPSNLNSPSVLTVDAVNGGHKTASSSAAKKVMDWFRRKSVVKESAPLQQVKATGRNDSADSFVRVEPTVVASAMSDTSSVAPTADGRITPAPPIAEEDEQEVVKETETETETEKEQERVPEPEPRASTASLAPPIEAPVKAEGNNSRQSLSPSPLPEPTHQPLASADAEPRTVRVSPPRATPSRSKSHGMPGGATPSLSSQATATAAGSEDSRLRVHMGVLDQSALSSKPPQDIMNEVIRVLMEMGMEVKRENEYRVRCTRVKRKGRGFGSVISMAGGVMGSASLSRVCLVHSAAEDCNVDRMFRGQERQLISSSTRAVFLSLPRLLPTRSSRLAVSGACFDVARPLPVASWPNRLLIWTPSAPVRDSARQGHCTRLLFLRPLSSRSMAIMGEQI